MSQLTAEIHRKILDFEQIELKNDGDILKQLLDVDHVNSTDAKATIVSTSRQIMEKWFARFADKPGRQNFTMLDLSAECYRHCSVNVSVPVDMS